MKASVSSKRNRITDHEIDSFIKVRKKSTQQKILSGFLYIQNEGIAQSSNLMIL